jgi:deoxyribose-phosphate aldolase
MLENLPSELRQRQTFARLFDHTLLKPDATPREIRTLCAEARTHDFAGVCLNPCYVALAAKELQGSPQKTMAVVGFPLGANRTDVKMDETLRAIGDGAKEIDMVINVGVYLGGDKTAVRHDIAAVHKVCGTEAALKVIFETAFLTPEQIVELSHWCRDLGVAFVKTSTGFGPRGATTADVKVMAETVKGSRTEVKASGGVRTLEAAIQMAAAGARRIGSSSSVKILEDFLKLG